MAIYYAGSNSTASNTIWTGWCNNTTGTSTTGSGIVWSNWCDNGTGSIPSGTIITSTSEAVWRVWSSTSTTATTDNIIRVPSRYVPPVETPEQQAATRERIARYEAVALGEKRLRELAEARAEELLVKNLNLEQRLELERHNHFTVVGRKGYRYRIRRGRSGNVDMVRPNGTVEHRLCAHPNEFVPDPDTMLAQKIMLEIDEDAFIRIANKHHVPRPSERVLPVLQ